MKGRRAENPETGRSGAAAHGFEALFHEHWNSVYRTLRRLVGDPAEAEDLALEAFLRLYRQHGHDPQVANPGGWLYRVATRLGLNAIRDGQRRKGYELSAGQHALEENPQLSPAEILAQQEQHQQVRRVLARMNERQSQLLILRYSGRSYKEIAAALDLAPTSIGPLLLRAEREFEKQYRTLVQEE